MFDGYILYQLYYNKFHKSSALFFAQQNMTHSRMGCHNSNTMVIITIRAVGTLCCRITQKLFLIIFYTTKIHIQKLFNHQ